MKKLTLVGCLVAAGALWGQGALGAQETTRHGGFGGPVVKLTEIGEEFGVLLGGRGGWIIDGSFVIGGGGYALVNQGNFEAVPGPLGDPGTLSMGYGGLELEYVHRPDERVHFSVGTLVGWGGLTWDPQGQAGEQESDGFFVAEPALNVVLNVARQVRAGVGVSYRFAQGVELAELRNGEISGVAGVLTLKFGSF